MSTTKSSTCPSCGSDDVRFSRSRNGIERLFRRLTSIAPWRCRDCGLRFWAQAQRCGMFAR